MAEVSYTLVVDQFVKRYKDNPKIALEWAEKNINKELFPVLKPLIQAALKARGFRVRED